MEKKALVFILSMWIGSSFAQSLSFYSQLNNTHDISLSPWGPYSKMYAGISHINDMANGMRFDVSVFPGYYRNKVLVPNVLMESGYFPWNISADMSQITYRYELEWKDRLYVDVTYSLIDSSRVLVAMNCVNNTDLEQALQLNVISYIDFPNHWPTLKAEMPNDVLWLNARDYKELTYARPMHNSNLVFDGWMRAEIRGKDFIDSYAIGKGFGKDKGDKAVFSIPAGQIPQNGLIGVRYRLKENGKLTFRTSGIVNYPVTFEGSGKFEMLYIPYNVDHSKQLALELISEGGSSIDINGFFFGEEALVKKVNIVSTSKNFTPVESSDGEKDLRLKFDDIDCHYGLAWDFSPSQKRRMLNDELDIFFRKYVHEHAKTTLTGNKQGFFSNIFIRPVEISPQNNTTVYGLICRGTENEVIQSLSAFNKDSKALVALVEEPENPFVDILAEGKKYEFCQTLLRATVLSNVVYPVYTQGQFIRHFTPGKWWNSLYTWDSGFIALGLAQIDIQKAIENLNAYTTPSGSQSAFIHHGSMVPTQMYAFFDIWNKTQSKEYLEYFYPRLKRYYEFFAGKAGNSNTAVLNSKLLKTWDYWGNSGGWDDYPPQGYVHWKKTGYKTSPVITTANAIRSAKILRMAAERLGLDADLKEYDKDIAIFSNALQSHSWDKESGYYSYVVHDEFGNPKEFLRHEPSGANYNMGLDGAYPLFSGICTKEQEEILLEKLLSDKHMWTPAGLGVVDQSAPYYRHDGYWNGTVWMPHQWFMWKTMFDLGRTDLAWKIAERALDVYSRETNTTYYTFEHFISKSTRGAGWHQFSGLSTPILVWFSAYFKPGTVTTGFETWIQKQSFAPDNAGYEATMSFDNASLPRSRSMVVVLNPTFNYEVFLNGKPGAFSERHKGVVEVELPDSNKTCSLLIQKIN